MKRPLENRSLDRALAILECLSVQGASSLQDLHAGTRLPKSTIRRLSQRAALLAAGVPEALIFAEKASGTTTDGRDELARLLAMLRPGDVLHVTRIDRLARSMHDFARLAHDPKERGIGLRVIQQQIDTTTGGPVGELTMNLLAAFASFETQIRRERQMEGIAIAKSAGKYKGRKPSVSAAEVKELRAIGLGPSAIARKLRCGRTTVYRLLEANAA